MPGLTPNPLNDADQCLTVIDQYLDRQGRTPLAWAEQKRYTEIVEILGKRRAMCRFANYYLSGWGCAGRFFIHAPNLMLMSEQVVPIDGNGKFGKRKSSYENEKETT